MKKKICFIVTDAVSFNYLMKGQLEFISSLDKYDVTLISGGEIEQLETLKKRNVGLVNFMPFSRKIKLLSDFKCLVLLVSYLFKNRQEVVVYSTPKAMLLGALASLITFHPVRIAIIRGRIYENFSGLMRKFYLLLDKLVIKASTKSLFISESLCQAYERDNALDNANYKVVANGSSNGINKLWVKERLQSEVILDISTKIKLNPEQDFLALTVGRLCEDKGVIELEHIFNNLRSFKNFKLICVGRTEDIQAERVVSKLSEEDNFYHFDQMSDVRAFYAIANLHLFLSHREGFGNVAIEAASFGVPTFGFDVVGVKDSIKDGVTGKLFPFRDSEGIIEAIKAEMSKANTYVEKYPLIEEYVFKKFESITVWEAYEKEFSNEKNI